MKYNYREAMKKDVSDYIDKSVGNGEIDFLEYRSQLDLETYLNNRLDTDPKITGAEGESYTSSVAEAEKNLCDNLGLLAEVFEKHGVKGLDMTIRKYLIEEIIDEVIEEIKDDFYKAYEDDEN